MYNFKVAMNKDAISLGTDIGKAYKELHITSTVHIQELRDTLRNERSIDSFKINELYAIIVAKCSHDVETVGFVQNKLFANKTGHYARMRGVDVQLELDRYAQAKEERAYNRQYAQEFVDEVYTAYTTYDGAREFDL